MSEAKCAICIKCGAIGLLESLIGKKCECGGTIERLTDDNLAKFKEEDE